MTKIQMLASALVVGGVFVAGVAVGKGTEQAKYVSKDEVKWKDIGGPKLGTLTGDADKGPFIGLLQLPGGFESPMHSQKGEDGAKAKKLPPGSYWTMPGGADHISVCEKGADCVIAVMQKTKFDFIVAKDAAKPADPKKPDMKPDPAKKM
jgi:hypothetical protein